MDGITVLIIIWVVSRIVKSAKGGKKATKKGVSPAQAISLAEARETARKARVYREQSGPQPAKTEAPAPKPAAKPVPARPTVVSPAGAQDVPAPDITWLLEEDCDGVTPEHGHAEGASHADDTGCVGGSMAHDTHEGRNMASMHGSLLHAKAEGPGNLAAKSAPQIEPVQSSAEKARFSAKEMRRAIVTSEILREPIALRGRTARR